MIFILNGKIGSKIKVTLLDENGKNREKIEYVCTFDGEEYNQK